MLSANKGLVALVLGKTGGWYVVTQMFEFECLHHWSDAWATLLLGSLVTIAVGLLGNLPVLRARPAAALRDL
jgi:putative ABC transport system permease protein